MRVLRRRAKGATGTGTGEGWLRRLAGYCWRFPRGVLLALGGTLLGTLVTAAIPLIQRDIVDNAILAHNQAIWVGASCTPGRSSAARSPTST